MVEKIWFQNHILGKLMWPLLWPLSLIYKSVSRSKRSKYLSGDKKSYRAPVPVIVVGNITAGGNGKTPVVIWLVEKLQQMGYKPGVVSRGYGGKAESYPLVLDSDTSVKQCGDEPKLIFLRTNAPVAVDPVRSNAVKALLDADVGVDIIVTDDGLQHYALQRDIEFIVVDGQRRFGNQSYIPLGPLREGLERLNQVDFIITNGGEAHQGEFPMRLEPAMAVNLLTGEKKLVTELGRVVAFAGIGHPPRFFKTLESLGADLVKTQGFADHKDFNQAELEQLQKLGDNVIMTEKDAVKCDRFAEENWWHLPVTACFNPEDEQQIIKRINEVRKDYGSPSA
ncbi:tetraacyldisaccharide 4'-kinase [Vibrio sp. JC009]|uniref:tetraacyldisaccharide 4'-kinase n=1 Tax=Vibrio sp. JC009 TaxID=2912314 RepID=UPI0023AE9364|nr:tetraacyldisaccharide 4'-kinase [Vibrio sp. JC009]WED20801.1 tetraacyldisaccharide 4'-kinase [Vibrio sp. JC009]